MSELDTIELMKKALSPQGSADLVRLFFPAGDGYFKSEFVHSALDGKGRC